MKNTKVWCENILNEIKNNPHKKIVLVAGASSSGKSYSSEKLNKYLNNNGIKACVFSADNYYKGISRTIVEKAFLLDSSISKYKNKIDEITNIVKKVTTHFPFGEKFNKNNLEVLKLELKPIAKKDASLLAYSIQKQFEQINFDEPFALDLNKLASDINSLISNNDIILPCYDFPTGEVTFSPINTLSHHHDVYIIEGLYVLRDEVYGKLDKNKVIPCCVNCDIKTLLSRKLNRDIKSERSALSPEQTVISYLTQVMPSYFKYIEPFNKYSQFTLSTTLSPEEIDKKQSSSQIKFKLNQNQLELLKLLPLEKMNDNNQTDYYFEDNSNQKNFIVRIRETDGLASKLTFKNNTNNPHNIDRKIEEYDLKQFTLENRNISSFIDKFIKSGFKLDCIINKNRKIFKFNNSTFKLDLLEELGYFIEFDKINSDTQKIIKTLNLTDVCTTPYVNLKNNKKQNNNQEKEFKFVVNKIPVNLNNPINITQYYFDFNKHENFLNQYFNTNLNAISSARVRITNFANQTNYHLTLKSKGGFFRNEYETKISKAIAQFLLKDNVISVINKKRFIETVDGFKFEFDEFDNGLKTVEVEVGSESNYNKITSILSSTFNLSYKDVTTDQNYKNENMATKCDHNLTL